MCSYEITRMSIQFEKIVHEVKKLFMNVRMFQIIVHVFQKIFIKFKKMLIYFTQKKKIIGTFYRIDALDQWKKTIYGKRRFGTRAHMSSFFGPYNSLVENRASVPVSFGLQSRLRNRD
jgi:hypothetical protein